ncbi:hypothetical protein K461DRAFT_88541 [Myriangium duriaei CBS 260.36]|uniref:Uncharacterized protein n=1 Tax=Myriangium duriaei CBS 260.36 TaxID=1168546 RepID=A0A9P4MIK0_9PEZI|nr:hypothetical protein K461DRAFT_88541 [Myriangium duriaei CBS 260.36]
MCCAYVYRLIHNFWSHIASAPVSSSKCTSQRSGLAVLTEPQLPSWHHCRFLLATMFDFWKFLIRRARKSNATTPSTQTGTLNTSPDRRKAPKLFVRIHYHTELGPGIAAGFVLWTEQARTYFKVRDQYGRDVHTLEIVLPSPPSNLSHDAVLEPYVCYLDDLISVFAPPRDAGAKMNWHTSNSSGAHRRQRDQSGAPPSATTSAVQSSGAVPSAVQDAVRRDSSISLSAPKNLMVSETASRGISSPSEADAGISHVGSHFTQEYCATHHAMSLDAPAQQRSEKTKEGFTAMPIIWEGTNPITRHVDDCNSNEVRLSMEHASLPPPEIAKYDQEVFAQRLNELEAIFQAAIRKHMENAMAATGNIYDHLPVVHFRSGPATDMNASDLGLGAFMKEKRMSMGFKELEIRKLARDEFGFNKSDRRGRLVKMGESPIRATQVGHDRRIAKWVRAKVKSEMDKENAKAKTVRPLRPAHALTFTRQEQNAATKDNKGGSSCAIEDDPESEWSTITEGEADQQEEGKAADSGCAMSNVTSKTT